MSKHQFALHLRGLPWSATLEQISEFMEGRAQPEVRVSDFLINFFSIFFSNQSFEMS